MPQNPISLLIAAKKGDRNAFSELHARFFAPVFRYIRKRVEQKETAEDIAQSVFLKLLESKSEIKNQGREPLNYLFTMARNAVIDYYRANGKSPTIPIDDADDVGQDPAKAIETTDTVWRLLKNIPPDQAEVLKMKFLLGYSTKDIANKLNKTGDAIRQIQCRALRTLRELSTSLRKE